MVTYCKQFENNLLRSSSSHHLIINMHEDSVQMATFIPTVFVGMEELVLL